jgi:hypothetical protein
MREATYYRRCRASLWRTSQQHCRELTLHYLILERNDFTFCTPIPIAAPPKTAMVM